MTYKRAALQFLTIWNSTQVLLINAVTYEMDVSLVSIGAGAMINHPSVSLTSNNAQSTPSQSLDMESPQKGWWDRTRKCSFGHELRCCLCLAWVRSGLSCRGRSGTSSEVPPVPCLSLDLALDSRCRLTSISSNFFQNSNSCLYFLIFLVPF